MQVKKLVIALGLCWLAALSCGREHKVTGVGDNTPPVAIKNLSARNPTDSSLTLYWTAPQDDDTSGNASRYDIRYSRRAIFDSTWNGLNSVPGPPTPKAAGTPETLAVRGLDIDTLYYFGIKSADADSNWSVLSNVASAWTAVDTMPPGKISDLRVSDSTYATLTVTWTAPGDDSTMGRATRYDLRISTSTITDANFATADSLAGEPQPATAGTAEHFTIFKLRPQREYHIALKAVDNAGNWSALSNVLSAMTTAVPDRIPPARITDLRVVQWSGTWAALAWTAPGDDGTIGTASSYDLRSSGGPITEANFLKARKEAIALTPSPAGSPETLTVSNLAEGGWYYFALKTSDEAMNWSPMSNVVGGSTPPDTIPPAAIADLHVADSNSTWLKLAWTAPGDDSATGTATWYNIRYSTVLITDENFDSATVLPKGLPPPPAGRGDTLTVNGLNSGTVYFFAVKTRDEAANWSPLSNVASGFTIKDTIRPAPITDLRICRSKKTDLDLCWTTPGDDNLSGTATKYDLRYSTSEITTENFGRAEDCYAGEPLAAGSSQSLRVYWLDSNTVYHFAIRTADEVGNWSELSNVAVGFTRDTIPPAPITTLNVVQYGPRTTTLSWKKARDDADSGGFVSKYDIRYSTSSITEENFAHAMSGLLRPMSPGAEDLQEYTVENLEPLTTYYFAVKAADDQPNWSPLSNVVEVTTPEGIPPAAIVDLGIVRITPSSLSLAWTAPGDDSTTGMAATYDVRYSNVLITDDNFTSATAVSIPPPPSAPGTQDTWTIVGLGSEVAYYIAIKTADEVPNWSALSNVVSAITRSGVDTVPPATVKDLHPTTMRSTSMVLSWSAPGDDSASGQAASYDLRYSTSLVSEESWDLANKTEGEPVPSPAGSRETFTVEGLIPGTLYYFAIKTADRSQNWSPLSTNVEGLTSTNAGSWHSTIGAWPSECRSIAKSPDGSYFLAGYESLAGFTAKIDATGSLVWMNTAASYDVYMPECKSIAATTDGGCITIGDRYEEWGYSPHLDCHIYIWKIDAVGNTSWRKVWNYSEKWCGGLDVLPLPDRSYVVSVFEGYEYPGLIGISETGDRLWGIGLGGRARSILFLEDGGLVVSGAVPMASYFEIGDIYAARLNSQHMIVWSKRFPKTGTDIGESVVQTNDGGFVVCGTTKSPGGDKDVYLLRLDSNGNLLWDKAIGGSADEVGKDIAATPDGNYVVVGTTNSYGAGGSDMFLIKIDGDGNVIWQKTIGGPYNDGANSIVVALDGGLVIAGWTESYGVRSSKKYVVKTDANGDL